MNSHITAHFRKQFRALPANVQRAAEEAYRTWQRDPFHDGLQFKQIRVGIWSVRIGLQWRGLNRRSGEEIRWFWIGSHSEYDKLI